MSICAIVGATEINDYDLLLEAIKKSKFKIKEVVSGGALGVDTLGKRYAEENNLPYKEFPAKWNDLTQPGVVIRKRWNKWKKVEEEFAWNAGFLRNQYIVDYADCMIALPGQGGGTRDSIKKAEKKGIPIYVHEPESKSDNGEAYEYEF